MLLHLRRHLRVGAIALLAALPFYHLQVYAADKVIIRDVQPLGASSGGVQMVLHDNTDGTFSEQVFTTGAGGDASAANQLTQISQLPSSRGAKTGALSLSVVPNTDTAFPVAGAAAHGASTSGGPLRIGSRALTANYAAVTTGQTADLIATLVGALITKPYSIPEADWNYAAASGGISNSTTAVTIAAAPAAGIRNYLTGIQISSDALGAATEIAVRDGAGGAVIWRAKLTTAGISGGDSFSFPSPLRGTAANLLEVVTLTASITGAVYFNAQGYAAP